jgi:hypothetical protein
MKTYVALLAGVMIFAGCSVDNPEMDVKDAPDLQAENFDNKDNGDSQIESVDTKDTADSKIENTDSQAESFDFSDLYTKRLYDAKYTKWRLVDENSDIQTFEIEDELKEYGNAPYVTLFIREDGYFVRNDATNTPRTGGLTGEWGYDRIEDRLLVMLDNGDQYSYRILELTEDRLVLEMLDYIPSETSPLSLKNDDVWAEYINENAGYAFSYPKKDDNWGDVEVVENGDVAMIAGYPDYVKDFKQRTDVSNTEKAQGIPMAFAVRDVANENEAEQFIKDVYGEACGMGELNESDREGEFWVSIETGDEMDEESGFPKCFINYITFVKYSPEKGKIASWDIGQDVNFQYQDETLDFVIRDSFRFL